MKRVSATPVSSLTVSPQASQRWPERHRGLRRCHREAHVKTCPDCNGDGVIEKGTDNEQQCPTCGGSGFVPDDDDDEEAIRTASETPTCLRSLRAADDPRNQNKVQAGQC